ncbi:MAG: carboxypeptidase regulatory-like domain-containing protein [Bacteroidota bacterium]
MSFKNITSIFLVVAISTLFFSCKAKPTETPALETKITGKVLDKVSNSALSGAVISTNPTTSSVTTDANGNYTIADVPAGQFTVTASKDGYGSAFVTVSVAEGKTVNADIQLETLKPQLAVSTEVVDFDIADNYKTFTITNKNKIGTVTWQISKDQPWIMVSPSSGTVTTETKIISLSVNRDSVFFGNYSGTITISSDAGIKTISILMTKVNPNAPQLTVSPPQLDFSSSQSSSAITIKNTGTGTINWTVTKSEPWILPSITSGSTTNLSPSSITLSVDRNGLAINNYSGTVTINSNAGNQTVPIKMEVAAGSIPAPILQFVSKTQTSITIGWTKSTSTSFASYKIYRSAVGGVTESATLLTTITNANTNTYTDIGLNSATTYYYKVYIYNTANLGSGSNEINVTTDVKLGTWVLQKQFSGVKLTGLASISDNDAWTVGYDGSGDGKMYHWDGSDWIEQTIPSIKYLSDIKLLSLNDGYTIGENGEGKIVLLRYNGISWNKMAFPDSINITGADIKRMAILSENNIWFGKGNRMYHYDGIKWSFSTLSSDDFLSVNFINANTGFAFSYKGIVFKWNGIGWGVGSNAPYHPYDRSYYDFEVQSENRYWTSYRGYDPNDYHTFTYDGTKWTEVKTKDSQLIKGNSIVLINESLGWIVGELGYIYRFDGENWSTVDIPSSSVLNRVIMLNANSGWAVGNDGVILRYK